MCSCKRDTASDGGVPDDFADAVVPVGGRDDGLGVWWGVQDAGCFILNRVQRFDE